MGSLYLWVLHLSGQVIWLGAMMDTSHFSTLKREARGQLGLHCKTLSQKTKETKQNKNQSTKQKQQ